MVKETCKFVTAKLVGERPRKVAARAAVLAKALISEVGRIVSAWNASKLRRPDFHLTVEFGNEEVEILGQRTFFFGVEKPGARRWRLQWLDDSRTVGDESIAADGRLLRRLEGLIIESVVHRR